MTEASTNKGVRRAREVASSTSSTESSPLAKQPRMASATEANITEAELQGPTEQRKSPEKYTLESVYYVLRQVQANTERLVKDYDELKESVIFQSKMVEDLKKENQDLKAKVEDLTKSLSKTEGIIEDAF